MKYYLAVLFTSHLLNFCHSNTEVHGKYFGRGVCSVYLRDQKKVTVKEIVFHNETTWEWCWDFPPWCTVVSRECFDFEPTKINIPHEHLKLKCCPGYKSNAEATACIPICSPFCVKGFCIDVDTCSSCMSGYTGQKCDRNISVSLTRGAFGSILSENLYCEPPCLDDNFICAPNKTCICAPGFNGSDCTTIIDPGAFIVHPGEKSCTSYIFQVIILLSLLFLSLCLIVYFIKRYMNIVEFEPLLDNPEPSASTSRVV